MADPRQVRPGVWKATLYAGKTADGRQRQTSRTFKANGIKAARKIARDFEKHRDDTVARNADRGATLNGLVDQWLATRDRMDSPATVYRRQSIVTAIRRDLGAIRPDQLTADDVDAFYNRLRDENVSQVKGKVRHRGESTIHHYHRVLTSILTYAYKRRKVPGIVTQQAVKPKGRRIGHAGNPPSPEDVLRLMAAAPVGLAAAVHLAAGTGMRRGELMALRWTDINADTARMTVARSLGQVPRSAPIEKSTKTDEPRDVDLDEDLIVVVDRHYRRMRKASGDRMVADAFVFADLERDPTGLTPHTPEWLSGQWTRLCRREGVKARFHDLRHFHATQLLAAGIDLPAVSQRLGHSLTSTTANIYAKATEKSGRAAAVAIRGVLAPPPGFPPPQRADESG